MDQIAIRSLVIRGRGGHLNARYSARVRADGCIHNQPFLPARYSNAYTPMLCSGRSALKGPQSPRRERRISTEVLPVRTVTQQSHGFRSASLYAPPLNQCFPGVISSACTATCCGSYCGCDASHLVLDFLHGHARGLSMVCNDRPHVGARDLSIGAFCCVLSSATLSDACVNVCGRDHDPLSAILISSYACQTCPRLCHVCHDDPAACLCCDRDVGHLQSDASAFPGGRLRGLRHPRHRQELPSKLD